MELTIHNTGTGGIPDVKDPRDYQWAEIGYASAPFDWTTTYDIEAVVGKLPVKDQGSSDSCGGQAWASYACAQTSTLGSPLIERSAKFIYAQTFNPGGGSAGRDNSNILVNKGAAPESVQTSYESGLPPGEPFMERPQDLTPTAFLDATLDKELSYANVNTDIDTVAQAIRDNRGVVIGLYGSNNGTWLSANPTPPQAGDTLWCHWVYAGKVKMVGSLKFIGILNSWGTKAGEAGWQWLGEDYFTSSNPINKNVFQCWTLTANPNPVSIPATAEFPTDLSYGETGTIIADLQKVLQGDGEFPKSVACSGYYGDITAKAVLAFQQKYQVAPLPMLQVLAGKKVGPATRAVLNTLTTSSASEPIKPNLGSWLASLWHLLTNK